MPSSSKASTATLTTREAHLLQINGSSNIKDNIKDHSRDIMGHLRDTTGHHKVACTTQAALRRKVTSLTGEVLTEVVTDQAARVKGAVLPS